MGKLAPLPRTPLPAPQSPWWPQGPRVTHDDKSHSHSLNIYDNFLPSPVPEGTPLPPGLPPGTRLMEAPHGLPVTYSATATGYRGAVNVRPINTDRNPADELMGFPNLPPDTTLSTLDGFARSEMVTVGMRSAMRLDEGIKAGENHSVTSISQGAGPSNTTSIVYNSARLGWTPAAGPENDQQRFARFRGTNMMNNLASAFGISAGDLTSADPNVNGPARQRFQQALINRVNQASTTELGAEARELFSQVAQRYEQNHNSVVVSAGNNGTLLPNMRADNGGRALTTPPGFFDNVLSAPSVTTVGALGPTTDGQVGVADYSSPTPRTTVNAWGLSPDGRPGTSFAAPRVAAVMRQLHEQNPNASSSEVEQMMIQRLFRNVPGSAPEEQPGAVTSYMQSQRW